MMPSAALDMTEPSVSSGAGPNGRVCSRCGSPLDVATPGKECARCAAVERPDASTRPVSNNTTQKPSAAETNLCAFCGNELDPETRGDVCADCLQSIHPEARATPVSHEQAEHLRAGRQLDHGKFTLTRCLGTGGMGQVWLAVDNSLTRSNMPPHLVALKFLAPRFAADKKARERLREEVLRGLQLSHDHIIRIHSWHEDANEPVFYTMEYAEGETLSNRAEKLPGQRFSWIELAPIAKQLCEAIAYAHARQVVHRDLKPGNILLTSTNVVKLADFGLAQSLFGQPVAGATTNPGGTPGYMSPQQYQGETSRASDDIYALGATLYKALTGTTPLPQGRGPRPLGEVLRQFRTHDVPPHVIQTITSCLAQSPANRPASVDDVSEKLGFYTSWEGDPIPLSPPRRRWLIPAVSAVILGVVGFLSVYWIRASAPRPELRVHLLSPASSVVLTAPAALRLEAAIEVTNDTVRWVEFQTNKVSLVRLLTAPYKFDWSSVPAGAYEISAVAMDGRGVSTNSAPVKADVIFPQREATPPQREVASPQREVAPPQREVAPPQREVAPPQREVAPPQREVVSHRPTRGMIWTNALGMEFLPLHGRTAWLSRYETRLADYLVFMTNHMAQNMRLASFSQHSDREPVVKVSWLDALKFCRWMTEREQKLGLLGMQQRYRLPRVDEWHMALGTNYSTKTGFIWGPKWPPPSRIGNLRGGEWIRSGTFGVEPLPKYEDGVLYTAPVGTFNPNLNGFFDLVGNVWEFCEKPGKNGHTNVVALGGAWDTDNPDELRASYEMQISPENLTRDDLGFRCYLDDSR